MRTDKFETNDASGMTVRIRQADGSFKDVPADKAESEMKKRDAKKILRRKT